MTALRLCPLLMQGMANTTYELHQIQDVRSLILDEDITACVGSRCAWWEQTTFPEDPKVAPRGKCGSTHCTTSFPDPAWSKP